MGFRVLVREWGPGPGSRAATAGSGLELRPHKALLLLDPGKAPEAEGSRLAPLPLLGDVGLTDTCRPGDTHSGTQRGPRLWLFWALGPTPPAGTALEEVSPCQPPAWREQRGPPHWPITGTE